MKWKQSLMGVVSWVFSFETIFVLYLFAGFYKSDPRLAFIPVDLTLFFFLFSLIVGAWILWKKRFRMSENVLVTVFLMGLFSGWMLISLLWAPRAQYGITKTVQFVALNGWALAGAAMVFDGNKARLRKFYVLLIFLAVVFSFEAYRLYFQELNFLGKKVFGSNYQSLGRLIGLSFVVATGFYLIRNTVSWKRWLYGGIVLFLFFVMLFIGARGPFIATMVASGFIVLFSKELWQRKLVWGVGLVVIFLVGSWALGPSMRTIYRVNVALVHTVGLEIPMEGAYFNIRHGESNVDGADGSSSQRAGSDVANDSSSQHSGSDAANDSSSQHSGPTFKDPKQASNKSFDLREQYFRNAINLWRSYPIFGAGSGAFAYFFPKGTFRVYPHNIVLEALSELGIVGLGLLLLLMLASFRGFFQQHAWRYPLHLVAMGVFLYTLLNAMISGDLTSNRHLFLAIGLIAATAQLQEDET